MLRQMTTNNKVVDISIVVATNRPVKFLKEIMRSVYRTSTLNLEVIVVNDDPSRRVTNSDFDSFFSELNMTSSILFDLKIINNEKNSGPGFSRNCGIDVAEGFYILFIDDDDELDLSVLSVLPDMRQRPDIIFLGFEDTSTVFTNYELQSKLPASKIFKITKLQQAFLENVFLPAQIQPYLFNREFLKTNKLKFPNAYVGEDLAFNTMAMLKAKSVFNIPGFFYKYISRPGTLKSSQGIERSIDLLRCLVDLHNFKNQVSVLSATAQKFCHEIMIFFQSLFCMRVLLASSKTENIISQSSFSKDSEIKIIKHVFENKIDVSELRDFINKIAVELKRICTQMLIPLLENFQKVFVFCVGSLGRSVAKLVTEGCNKEVIFVDEMFDKFPTKKVDGLGLISPKDLYNFDEKKCVIVCNPQPAIETKIANEIKKNEQSGTNDFNLIFGSQLIKESASLFFGKCEVVF